MNLDGVPLEEALQQILSVNGFFYKVHQPADDHGRAGHAAMHQKYDDLVVQVFYLSHADATELVAGHQPDDARPAARAMPAMYPGQDVEHDDRPRDGADRRRHRAADRANDKPRAEVVIEVQILEVNRDRVKQLGINLSDYALGLTFSPEVAPPNTPGPPSSRRTRRRST